MKESNDQLIKEMSELQLSEKKIKENILKQGPTEIKFERYGLINKDWIKKYKEIYNFDDFIKTQKINSIQNGEDIFILKDLTPKFEVKTLKDDNGKHLFNVNLPSNFTIVREDFINSISKKLKNDTNETPKGTPKDNIIPVKTPTGSTIVSDSNHQQISDINDLVFEAIIGGRCIIIKDKKNERSFFIQLYLENTDNKKNMNNIIDPDIIHYFINFEEKSMEEELKIILTEGLGAYFLKNHLELFTYQQILSKNQLIGFIYNLTSQNYSSTQMVLDINYHLKIDKKKNINNYLNPYFSSILICLFQIDNLRVFFSKINSNIDYKENTRLFFDFFKHFNSKPIESLSSIEKHMLKSEEIEDFEKTIQIIISKLDLELIQNKNDEETKLNQVKQYDENAQREIILKIYNNGSIFHQLFNSIKEKIIHCKECNMIFYNFEFIPFLVIDSNNENKNINLTERIYGTKKTDKTLKCNMCQKETENSVEEKINQLSQILIIIIKGNKKKYFNIKENITLKNNQKNLQYNLFCFVDNDYKIYTFRYKNNQGTWYKYNDNYQKDYHELNNENPIVLFYNLIQLNNNNINNKFNMNNMNNINNMNNMNFMNNMNNMIFMNMFNNINNFNNKDNSNNNYNESIQNMLNYNKNCKNGGKQNNNQEINNINNKDIDDYFKEDENENPLFVTFTIEKDNKQIYLDVREDMAFKEVKNKLENKYDWLQKIQNKTYYFNHQKIDENKTLGNLRILNNSNVVIKI